MNKGRFPGIGLFICPIIFLCSVDEPAGQTSTVTILRLCLYSVYYHHATCISFRNGILVIWETYRRQFDLSTVYDMGENLVHFYWYLT